MRIFKGRKEAEKIFLDLKKRIAKEGINPKLAVILIGQDKASNLYVKLKRKACQKIGMNLLLYKFEERERERKIIEKIKELNKNPSVNGIIVQLPLPKKFKTDKITGAISLKKDVDGFKKNSYFLPVLPLALLFSLKKGIKSFKGKKIIALVNSKTFGETLKKFLKKRGIKINYFLAKNRPLLKIKKIQEADVLITVLGRPSLIKGEIIKRRAVLIDAGITKIGSKKVVGDVDRESVKNKASFLTPVPGGIGPLTVALLLKNVYLAARNK